MPFGIDMEGSAVEVGLESSPFASPSTGLLEGCRVPVSTASLAAIPDTTKTGHPVKSQQSTTVCELPT